MRKISGAELAGLIALRSVCLPGQGRISQVLIPGGNLYDPRRIRSLLEALARHFAVDIVALRQRCGELLGMRNYLPLPLSSQMVLVPLTLAQMGEKTGYINLLSISKVLPRQGFCGIALNDGTELECWLSECVVRGRLLRAKFALTELAAAGMLPGPGADKIWQQKLSIIRAILE